MVFDIYLGLGVYLHFAVEVLFLAPTISPIGYKRRLVLEVSRRFAIIILGLVLKDLQIAVKLC